MQICGRALLCADIKAIAICCMLTGAAPGGCASIPASFEPPQTTGHQPDGSFALSQWERGLNCNRLNQAIEQRLAKMAQITKAEQTARQDLPPTLLAAISWSSGNPAAEGKRYKLHRMQMAEARSYHGMTIAKSCPKTINLEQRAALLDMPRTPYRASSIEPTILHRQPEL